MVFMGFISDFYFIQKDEFIAVSCRLLKLIAKAFKIPVMKTTR